MSAILPSRRWLAPLSGLFWLASSTIIQAEFETEKGWNGHLFSSFIVATATVDGTDDSEDEEESSVVVLGDRQGLLGVTLEAEEDDQEVTVTITCDAILEPSIFTGTLPKAGTTYTIHPKIKYKYDVLTKRLQTGPINITYHVSSGDEEEEKSETLTLRSVNDCPYTIVQDDERRDVSYMFAAYVNEQHPFVDKILREALNHQIVDSFTGYQAKDKTEVYRQAYALWHTLNQRDVRYSNITSSVAESDSVGSQHVRLIDESINNRQANCVDGSVLLASLLRKIGIEPVLVMVPGHCYLAFYLDEECTELTALETTMIGSEVDDETTIGGLEGLAGDVSTAENSWKTFTAAIAVGVTNLKENATNFNDAVDPDYQLISVIAARKRGVLPIAFQANQKFLAVTTDADADTATSDDDAESKD